MLKGIIGIGGYFMLAGGLVSLLIGLSLFKLDALCQLIGVNLKTKSLLRLVGVGLVMLMAGIGLLALAWLL